MATITPASLIKVAIAKLIEAYRGLMAIGSNVVLWIEVS